VRRRLALVGLVALPRLLVLPLNENLYGDAVARTWLAHVWLQHPHVIGSFDQGGFQFGPLHLYLLALAEWLWPSLLHAGRVASFVAGVATTLPLEALTRRLFGQAAATWAVFALACWGMHVQCSSTSASEALGLLLVLAAVERLSAWHQAPADRAALLLSALWVNLACATRYDAWLLVPLLGLVVFARSRSLSTAAAFVGAASAFAAGWLFGNWVDRGSPLFPFGYIDDFHRAWYRSEEAFWGRPGYQLLCLGFWPGAALLTLTPPVAVAGFAGLWRAWRAGRARWLVVLVVVPTLAYTVRSVALASFVPLARFTVKELALLLPFVWLGAEGVLQGRPRLRRALVAASAAGCVAWGAGLGWACYRTSGQVVDALRPVAATSTNEARTMAVAGWLGAHMREGTSLVVDEDPQGYDDLTVAYFSGFAYEAQARRRSPMYRARLAARPPSLLVRFDGGRLEREGALQLRPGGAVLDGVAFDEVSLPHPRLHVYQRAPGLSALQ
jgi:Dolichyl-phosphate-mannose-protein mannosyltransferase